MRNVTAAFAAGVLVLLVTGCSAASPSGPTSAAPSPSLDPDSPVSSGTQPPTTPGSGGPSVAPAEVAAELTVVYSADGKTRKTWTLTCQPTGGTHPQVGKACAAVAKVGAGGFAPVPSGVACTEVYGGPQTATVTGTVGGTSIDARFNRVNGCQLERWGDLVPLLPQPD